MGHPSTFQPVSRNWLRYCSHVGHRRPTKLCTMFGRLLGCYAVQADIFSGTLDGILLGAKFTLRLKYCVLLCWQRCRTALEQWPSAKLCGVVQGMELWNFGRGRHLYLAGRPSHWASAHILVVFVMQPSQKTGPNGAPTLTSSPTDWRMAISRIIQTLRKAVLSYRSDPLDL